MVPSSLPNPITARSEPSRAEPSREALLYRGSVVSSFFVTARSLSYSYRTPSREVLASLRGRRAGRHMMGSEGEAEQSEDRPAEAEPASLRTRLVRRPREGCVSAGAELGVLRYVAAASASLRQRNSVPSTHMRCMTTARRRARATIAFLAPRRRATCIPQALSQDHVWVRVSST